MLNHVKLFKVGKIPGGGFLGCEQAAILQNADAGVRKSSNVSGVPDLMMMDDPPLKRMVEAIKQRSR